MGRAEEAPNRPVKSGEGLRQYYLSHIHDLLLQLRVKTHNLHRLEAQRNDLNSKGKLISHFDHLGFANNHPMIEFLISVHMLPVRMLREELQLLQEPGSYVGEVVKVMGKTKVLVKVLIIEP